MGLRLYQPPVASDLPAKATADRSARSRSTIRRGIERNEERVRERRRRVLAAAAAYNNSARRPTRSSLSVPSVHPRTTDPDDAWIESGRERVVVPVQGPDGSVQFMEDRVATLFGERWARLELAGNSLRDDGNSNPSPALHMAVEPDFLSHRSQLRREPTYTLSNLRSTQAPNQLSRSRTQSQSSGWPHARRHRSAFREDLLPSPGGWTPAHSTPWALDADGLGDRNRSLSPEGDHVWDTLLSTLTPDPQPPSVGSSFASASASASAAASQGQSQNQSNPGASSRTSFTTPDTADETLTPFEFPCESGCDNSDTEGDEDDEMDQMAMIPGLTSSRRPSAPRRTGDDPVELLGGIGGMQRIVRNLARREDIPDEWWADAGLSRTLSRESSGN
ncbi:hypothetical protein B0J18DRAFT_114406 [Chaetomium sp. MPI-SDFR-AT-0129]|nr:hypothetical protein B0J18DRAFT_114406 [Chaetomium sp. MPI-SDFR-AT-0129]